MRVLQVMPTLACNFQCTYCYEKNNNHLNPWKGVDMESFKMMILEEFFSEEEKYGRVILHGGEVTTLPIEDLEELLKFTFILNKKKDTSIQSNGYNITDKHIKLFKKYKTNIGISIDGPWPLNKERGIGPDIESRRKSHQRVMENIKKMRDNNISVSTISILNENHMGKAKEYIEWLKYLKSIGITNGRMNIKDHAIGDEIQVEDVVEFYKTVGEEFIFKNPNVNFSPIRDMLNGILYKGTSGCVFSKCNMDATQSCIILHSNGQLTSCLHTVGEKDYIKDRNEDSNFAEVRDRNLRNIPMDKKGCKECRYYELCYGGCPSNTEGDPLTERTKDCEVYYNLFKWLEKKMKGIMPLIDVMPNNGNPFETIMKNNKNDGGHTDLLMDDKGNIVDEKNWNKVKKEKNNFDYDDHTDQLIDPETGKIVWDKKVDGIENKPNFEEDNKNNEKLYYPKPKKK